MKWNEWKGKNILKKLLYKNSTRMDKQEMWMCWTEIKQLKEEEKNEEIHTGEEIIWNPWWI